MVAISMKVNGNLWHADDDDALTELLEAVFDTPRLGGWSVSMIAQPKDGTGTRLTRVADNRLRIASDPIGGWGALNFLQLTLDGHTWQAWETFNPHPSEAAPDLTLGRNGLAFPRNAALPICSIYKAVAEYAYTAARPEEVLWQNSNLL